jgi:hypothetical protein
MLLAVLVHAEAFKVNVPTRAELRLDRPRDIDRRLHRQLLHPALHHREVDRDHTRHLNGTTERDFTIALRKMQITDRELCTFHMHRQVHLAAAREILDIAVATMFWATRHSARAFFTDFLFDVCVGTTGVHALGLGRQGDVAVHVRAGFDQAGFALVPDLKDFGRRGAA